MSRCSSAKYFRKLKIIRRRFLKNQILNLTHFEPLLFKEHLNFFLFFTNMNQTVNPEHNGRKSSSARYRCSLRFESRTTSKTSMERL